MNSAATAKTANIQYIPAASSGLTQGKKGKKNVGSMYRLLIQPLAQNLMMEINISRPNKMRKVTRGALDVFPVTSFSVRRYRALISVTILEGDGNPKLRSHLCFKEQGKCLHFYEQLLYTTFIGKNRLVKRV